MRKLKIGTLISHVLSVQTIHILLILTLAILQKVLNHLNAKDRTYMRCLSNFKIILMIRQKSLTTSITMVPSSEYILGMNGFSLSLTMMRQIKRCKLMHQVIPRKMPIRLGLKEVQIKGDLMTLIKLHSLITRIYHQSREPLLPSSMTEVCRMIEVCTKRVPKNLLRTHHKSLVIDHQIYRQHQAIQD